MIDAASFPKVLYGLPTHVKWCSRCLMSNQRPSSFPEFKHTKDRVTPTLRIVDGVCDACRYAEWKRAQEIDWAARERALQTLCDQHRGNGAYDCIVPGSGGKDSCYASHVLKHKYGMNPLTVTWEPILRTEIGQANYEAWISEFDNVAGSPPGNRVLTRLAIENLLHPFQSFILGQKNFAPKIAAKYNIPLIFYGENEAEYGNPVGDNASSLRSRAYYTAENLDQLYLGGVPIKDLPKHGLSPEDIEAYLPLPAAETPDDMEVHYLGYYLPWTPQEAYYYAVEHCGFRANPFRSEGTYSKYNSLDDKIDGLHYYTTYIKFGLGRATYDASQEIRNGHLTRDEGLALVKRFDGEFPRRYFLDVLDYIEMAIVDFHDLCEAGKSPHLWLGNQLRHTAFCVN